MGSRVGRRWEEVESQFPGASEREQFQEVLRGLLDGLVSGLVQGTIEAADAASLSSVDDVRAHPRRLASFTLPAHTTNRALKQFLHHTLYYSEPMAGERRRSATQIAELFEFWVAHPDKLPANYVESLANSPGASRGLRLHRRHDRRLLPALLSANLWGVK